MSFEDQNAMAQVQPNLNAEVYRSMTPADRPPIPDKHLQFISIYNENSAILGGSNMTDRYWSGTVWYYNSIADFDRNKAYLATKTESGVCDAVFLESDKFVIGEDSGALQVLQLTKSSDDSQELQCAGYTCLHDDSLLSLSAFEDKCHVVSGGMDCCIKVWDITELMAIQSFNSAHTDIVTCVDSRPGSLNEFASTSFDSEALLWDTRKSKPALSILKKDVGLTAVNWNPSLSELLSIGTDDGEVIIIDIRKTSPKLLQESRVFPKPIHKLSFNPNSERWEELAVCCDDVTVVVLDMNFSLSVYKDDRHNDFTRDFAWFNNNLYSCSWDNEVLQHVVHP
ncbi:methylosome protein 50-like [Ceratina calcarata]|uniref:Methylosome protein 50-like n=1 Tax=Ceratina calcarata TaxID=156304 RepID=A0AAJ7WD35_9HYME|nr:methylosome protein 50-like [Ceratina calcarata]